MWSNPQFPEDLVTFTEETINGKFHFYVQWSRHRLFFIIKKILVLVVCSHVWMGSKLTFLLGFYVKPAFYLRFLFSSLSDTSAERFTKREYFSKGALIQIWKSPYMFRSYIKTIAWKFRILNPKNYRIISPWNFQIS